MNLEPIIQSEASKKEEKKVSYTDAYIWNLERWYWWIYFQGSIGETHIENRLMGVGAGEEGWVRYVDRVTWKLTLPYVK